MSSHRILFVNASESEKIKFERSVRGIGYEVDYAPNGIQALSMLKKQVYSVMITTYQVDIVDSASLLMRAKEFNKDIITILIAVSFRKADVVYYYGKCQVDGVLFYPVDYDSDMVPLLNECVTSRVLDTIQIEDGVKKFEEKKRRKELISSVVKVLDSMDSKWQDTRRLLLSLLEQATMNSDGGLKPEGVLTFKAERQLLDNFRSSFSETNNHTFREYISYLKSEFNDESSGSTIKIRQEQSLLNFQNETYMVFDLVVTSIVRFMRDDLSVKDIAVDFAASGESDIEVIVNGLLPAEAVQLLQSPKVKSKKRLLDKVIDTFSIKYRAAASSKIVYQLILPTK